MLALLLPVAWTAGSAVIILPGPVISGILGWGRYDNWYVNYMKKNAESGKPFMVYKQVRERLDLDILHGEKKVFSCITHYNLDC